MTNRTDTDAIEDRLARNRDRLASTLDELQDRVSIDHLAREALDTVKTNAAAYTRSIDRAVRANPLALALTGVGIAWLVFGNRDSAEDDDRPRAALPYRPAGAEWPGRGDRMQGEDWSDRIDRMRQREHQADVAPVLIVTHPTPPEAVSDALGRIARTGVAVGETVSIRIEKV